jgi:hypothetical protein
LENFFYSEHGFHYFFSLVCFYQPVDTWEEKYKIFNFGNSAGMAFCFNLWVDNTFVGRLFNF